MKKLWYSFISILLFFLLIIQIHGIIELEVENINEQQYYNKKNEIEDVVESPMVPPVSLYDVLESIYTEYSKCRVLSFCLEEDGRYIEAELSMTGTIDDIELMLSNLQNSRGFKEIKKYIEGEGAANRIFVTFEL
ncbi:hypothetical protein [Clostridium thermarum]|uniref:hypothetical protein n=1 Tax=Clostridium thermarum TaxID=1716543 RepID=UPI0013D09D13|nr:hypothetical protein [Clostridium thermarum]